MNFEELFKILHNERAPRYSLFPFDFENTKATDFLVYLANRNSDELVFRKVIAKNWEVWKNIPDLDWLTALEKVAGSPSKVERLVVTYYNFLGIHSVNIVLESDAFREKDKEHVKWLFENRKNHFIINASVQNIRVMPSVSIEDVTKAQERLVSEGAPKAEYIDPSKYIRRVKGSDRKRT